MIRRLFLASLALAALCPAVGFLLHRQWGWAAICLLSAGLWLAGWRRKRSGSALGLTALLALASIGTWKAAGAGWMLGGVLATLAAWDLEDFERRLQYAAPVAQAAALERRHLLRLSTVLVLGLLGAIFALLVHVNLTLGIAALLALLTIWGLSRLIAWMRRESQ